MGISAPDAVPSSVCADEINFFFFFQTDTQTGPILYPRSLMREGLELESRAVKGLAGIHTVTHKRDWFCYFML